MWQIYSIHLSEISIYIHRKHTLTGETYATRHDKVTPASYIRAFCAMMKLVERKRGLS